MLCLITLLVIPVAASAQAPAADPAGAPLFELPQKARVITEVNLSESDVLGIIKRAVKAFSDRAMASGGQAGEFVAKLNLDELFVAIEGVKAVRMREFVFDQPAAPGSVIQYFSNELQGWTRLFYSSQPSQPITVAVYTLAAQQFACVTEDTKRARYSITTVTGFVDLEKLADWLGSAANAFPKAKELISNTSAPK